MSRGVFCAAAMVLSTFGCESPTQVIPTALVTDGTSFRLEKTRVGGQVWYHVQIPYGFTNRTGSNVYLPNCLGDINIRLETREDGGWVYLWSPIVRLCLSPPIVIEPDEVYETTLEVSGLSRMPSAPVRIVWNTGLSSYDPDARPIGEPIPFEERISNSFRLRVFP